MQRLIIEDTRLTFSFAGEWLSEDELEETITELAMVEIRKQRLSPLIAKQGFTRPKTHKISGVAYGVQPSLGAGRYATALDTKFDTLMAAVLSDRCDQRKRLLRS